MKNSHLSVVPLILIIFLGFELTPAHADDANGVSIQNISIQPYSIKVGDTFTVTATLVNNSTVPIVVETGKCSTKDTQVPFFTVLFDNHVKSMAKNINCAGVGWSEILDPGKKNTSTSPDYTLNYTAIKSGTANVTMTFQYHAINRTDLTQPNIEQTISKSFQFLIHDINETSVQKLPAYFMSPLKQFKSGIAAKDVKCILGFELILKTENNSPACVELETAQKFVDRGWANEIISNVLNSGTIVTIPVNSSISTSGLTFSPSTVRVVIGVNNTVEWINMDNVMNDVTSDDRSFETSLIPHGHAWEHIFDKTGTYQYHSAIHPWLKGTVIVVENNTSSQQISNSDQQDKLLSESDCGQFYTVPENHTSLNTVPVLLMKTNSTACAKLTFTIISNYNDCNGPNCQHVLDVEPTGLIGNLHYEKHGGSFSITSGKDYTNSFKIMTIPSMVDLANYPIGTNYTITYIIRPLSNATGFYDQSIPRLACERYPLAVGYAADQVNASDFSYIDTLNPPCALGVYGLTKVEVSGMGYKEVTLRLAVLEQMK